MNSTFKYIGFDADDTLWVNETYFRETEHLFCALIADYVDEKSAMDRLYKTEISNLKDYGYGIKGFILSLIETAIELSKGEVSSVIIEKVIKLGKEFLNKPVELIDGVESVLERLTQKGYKLIVATKGDLLDQERKLERSNLGKYFHHIEIMSDKQELNYQKLLSHLDIDASDFLMIGNSLKSDILPVLSLGGSAVHVPFHTTWIHEQAEHNGQTNNFWELESLSELEEVLCL